MKLVSLTACPFIAMEYIEGVSLDAVFKFIRTGGAAKTGLLEKNHLRKGTVLLWSVNLWR